MNVKFQIIYLYLYLFIRSILVFIISFFKVIWSEYFDEATPGLTSIREKRHNVPGDQLHFTFPDLEEDTTYLIQVCLANQNKSVPFDKGVSII